MDTLGDDLLLLAIDPRKGLVRRESQLRFGLMGSELVRLAAAGHIDIQDDRIVVSQAPISVGGAELGLALQSIISARRPPKPRNWIARPRNQIVRAYLTKLAAAGIIERSGTIVTRWRINDQARAATARAKLDAVALGSGPVDAAQAAFAGLAHAAGLDYLLYPGLGNRAVHKRMKEIARGQWTSTAVQDAIPGDQHASQASTAANESAMTAASQAAVAAAVQAATLASVQAASAAASSAATSAAMGG